MSLRRGETVSPLIGCLFKAVPSAVQSRRVPSSKSRFSVLPSLPLGRTPSGLAALEEVGSESEQRQKIRTETRNNFISANGFEFCPIFQPTAGGRKPIHCSASQPRQAFQSRRISRVILSTAWR